jgi:hypothetical protein
MAVNRPNGLKICPAWQDTPKFTQIWIFGEKIDHLATWLQNCEFSDQRLAPGANPRTPNLQKQRQRCIRARAFLHRYVMKIFSFSKRLDFSWRCN